jgi:rod shape-determining protein MreC
MNRLMLFVRRVYVLLIFLVLEGLAVNYYANSSPWRQAQLLTVSNKAVGWFYRQIGGVTHFFSLGVTNRLLEERVAELENELGAYREHYGEEQLEAIADSVRSPYEYVVGRVIRNSVNRAENYIMVRVGAGDEERIEKGMAVVSLMGAMVGYVEAVDGRNAICISALNRSFRASGSIKGTDHFGSISWTGRDARHLELSEVPKYAPVAVGDTIVTTGYSFYFPEGILIGTVDDIETVESTASYNIAVRMSADISRQRDVMLIRNDEARDRFKLEEDTLGGTLNP